MQGLTDHHLGLPTRVTACPICPINKCIFVWHNFSPEKFVFKLVMKFEKFVHKIFLISYFCSHVCSQCHQFSSAAFSLGGGLFQTSSGLGSFICLMSKENWKYFSKIKFYVLPLLGVWKIAKTHNKPKNENHCMGVFDSSNEAFDALIIMQKTKLFAKSCFVKKSRKIAQNYHLKKITICWWFFLIFKEIGPCNQCIKTLHLSFETPPCDNFHFWG